MYRKLPLFLLILVATITYGFSGAGREAIESFRISVQTHDARDVSRFFDHTVDMTYGNTQSTYSKTQARMILNDFYTRHNPHSFKVDYIGSSPANDAQYVIGTAGTANGNFKVYLYIRQQGQRQIIREMKISR